MNRKLEEVNVHRRGNHMGTGFEIWTDERGWYWCLSDPRGNRGATGAAATEAEAEREVRWSIEEMSPKGRLR